MKKYLYSLLFSLICSFSAFANCSVDNTADMSGTDDCVLTGGFFGQAFVSCQTGTWTTLRIFPTDFTGSGTASVYIDEGEVADNSSTTRKLIGTFTTTGIKNFTLSKEVLAGSKYIWWVELGTGISKVCYGSSAPALVELNDYVHSPREGNAETSSISGSLATRSLTSSSARMNAQAAIFVAGIVAAASAPIPTLSQWGLLIFALLMLNLGVFFIYKKETKIS